MKRIKLVVGLGVVAMLASCNYAGKTITAETAKERADGIINYQKQNSEELSKKSFSVNMKMKEIIDDSSAEVKINLSADLGKEIYHIAVSGKEKTSVSSNDIHFNMYIGKIDGVIHFVETESKTYSTDEDGALSDAINSAEMYIVTISRLMSNGTNIFGHLPWDLEEINEYSFKSKGEGHLYVSHKKLNEQEDYSSQTIENYEFENNMLKNINGTYTETRTYGDKTTTENMDVNLDVKWNCKLSMPNISGYEKK